MFLIFYYFYFYFAHFNLFIHFFLYFFLFYIFLTYLFYFLSLLISFPLSFSPLGLFLIQVCILVMSVDSKFVFEFIVWVMVIMLVHSICQKCIYVRAWLPLRVVHESTTFKGMRESFCCFASQAYSLSS